MLPHNRLRPCRVSRPFQISMIDAWIDNGRYAWSFLGPPVAGQRSHGEHGRSPAIYAQAIRRILGRIRFGFVRRSRRKPSQSSPICDGAKVVSPQRLTATFLCSVAAVAKSLLFSLKKKRERGARARARCCRCREELRRLRRSRRQERKCFLDNGLHSVANWRNLRLSATAVAAERGAVKCAVSRG